MHLEGYTQVIARDVPIGGEYIDPMGRELVRVLVDGNRTIVSSLSGLYCICGFHKETSSVYCCMEGNYVCLKNK